MSALIQSTAGEASEVNNREVAKQSHGVVKKLDTSQLTHFPAANPTGTAVLICPGGGYARVSVAKEGHAPAAFLNALGIDAWVLDYTTASTATPPVHPRPRAEALAALDHIRAHHQNEVTTRNQNGTSTAEPKLRLGIWGFSAGGRLAALTLTDPAARLDFGVLAYPVIILDGPAAHAGSRDNLVGADAPADALRRLSAHNRVSAATPPAFLFHTFDDAAVPVQNTLLFAEAMAAHKRPTQVLVLPDGSHGLGLALDDPQRSWTPELARFLKYSVSLGGQF